ncbi:hypothetical protein CEXT_617731 [Caerostris extrusa]|uniref:Uncharacterized protein n=1 Tax=Caerostris extrusa TaxID=172846 RepID=A0AAV4PVJ3_CAEEX|nr:hypothetical protein CEXT_617731 [Caerostris extrusa]
MIQSPQCYLPGYSLHLTCCGRRAMPGSVRQARRLWVAREISRETESWIVEGALLSVVFVSHMRPQGKECSFLSPRCPYTALGKDGTWRDSNH